MIGCNVTNIDIYAKNIVEGVTTWKYFGQAMVGRTFGIVLFAKFCGVFGFSFTVTQRLSIFMYMVKC